jgi:hypothetical protein
VLKLAPGERQLFHDDLMLKEGVLPILHQLLQHIGFSSQPTWT